MWINVLICIEPSHSESIKTAHTRQRPWTECYATIFSISVERWVSKRWEYKDVQIEISQMFRLIFYQQEKKRTPLKNSRYTAFIHFDWGRLVCVQGNVSWILMESVPFPINSISLTMHYERAHTLCLITVRYQKCSIHCIVHSSRLHFLGP